MDKLDIIEKQFNRNYQIIQIGDMNIETANYWKKKKKNMFSMDLYLLHK